MGPFDSGKSFASIMEILLKAHEHKPGPSGIRKSRWVVVRNSYRELQDTTIKTFNDWVPNELGEWTYTTLTFLLKFNDIECEILFRALDRPRDVKKLLSLELTGAFLNECKEIPKPIFDVIQGRVGRYPSPKDGGPTWYGIIFDTNPPDEDHYLYKTFEEKKPKHMRLFKQPSGLSPLAENVENLPEGYYTRMMEGKDREWVKVYVEGAYGSVQDGKPIYPEFNSAAHVANTELDYVSDLPVYVGLDFGLTPAALIAQKHSSGQWYILREFVTEDMGAARFSRGLKEFLTVNFPGAKFNIFGDPAGMQRAQTDEKTPFDILWANGIDAEPTHTNDFTIRRDTQARLFLTLAFNGEPAVKVDPRCRTFIKACNGGYRYRRIQVTGDERYQDQPDKTMYSHVAEAGQYLFLGAGEDRGILDRPGQRTASYKAKGQIRHG